VAVVPHAPAPSEAQTTTPRAHVVLPLVRGVLIDPEDFQADDAESEILDEDEYDDALSSLDEDEKEENEKEEGAVKVLALQGIFSYMVR